MLVFALASVCFADGIVLPRVVDPGAVRIPDQEALISYVNGVETLAIETRFKGEGSEFAWIVPTPSRPEVSAGTLGTFPSLRALFAPRLKDLTGGAVLVIVIAGLLLVLVLDLLFWRKPARLAQWLALLGVLVFAGALFTPRLGSSRGLTAGIEPPRSVRVHERKIVGAYDVAVLGSQDGGELTRWLNENGFATPAAIRPVVDQYVKEGWSFVASRLRRDESGEALMTPHPLVLRFAAMAPVYPMRLTAQGMGESLALDLYVFGSGTASAQGMSQVCSAEVQRPGHRPGKGGWPLVRDPENAVEVSHSAIAALTAGAMHATKLSGSFKPLRMAQDLAISIGQPGTKNSYVVSHEDAVLASVAAFLASSFLAGLVLLVKHHSVVTGARRVRLLGAVGGVGLAGAGAVMAWMPRVDTVPGRHAYFGSMIVRDAVYRLTYGDEREGLKKVASLDEARARLRERLSTEAARYWRVNDLKEGDGPGEYRLESEDGWLVLKYVDFLGREERGGILPLDAPGTR
jgi:Uncharacterized protein conserved in bacteria (DUF2330)